MAAASAGSAKRTNWVSVATPCPAAMSPSTPPAATAVSCCGSPTSRTLPPRPRTYSVARANSTVPAMPASSTTTNVPGPMSVY